MTNNSTINVLTEQVLNEAWAPIETEPTSQAVTTPKVRFKSSDGSVHEVEAREGDTLMSAAVREDVPGIIGQCGGQLSCGTCRVHLSAEDFERIPKPTEDERDMLEFLDDVQPTTRLSCQIEVSSDVDGLEMDIAQEN